MTVRASIEQLRRARTKTVVVDVPDDDGVVPTEFVISKIKVGQRKRLASECVDEHGMLDLEHAARLACEMCVVDPKLTADDIDEIDLDVFLDLSAEIATHSNLATLAQAATPDPEEGSDAVKSFPASDGQSVVGERVDAAAVDEGAGLDA